MSWKFFSKTQTLTISLIIGDLSSIYFCEKEKLRSLKWLLVSIHWALKAQWIVLFTVKLSIGIMQFLKVRQIRNDFFKPTFLPKNVRTNSTLLLVNLFSFIFWKTVKTPKRHFEINWPLMPGYIFDIFAILCVIGLQF